MIIKTAFSILACLLFITTAQSREVTDSSNSLKFDYDFKLGTFLDNGEYKFNDKTPQTLSGVYVIPTVGIRFNGNHRIMAGVSFLQQFGQESFGKSPDFMAYYNYNGDLFNGFGGILPRSEMKGHYSRAMFSDSVGYFKHSMAGALLQWEGERGYIEVFIDWNFRDDKNGKESFMAGSAGRLNLGPKGLFYVGYSGYMYHYLIGKDNAIQEGAPNSLVDNVMYEVYGGVNLAERTALDVLSLEVGVIGSMSRGRATVDNPADNNSSDWIARAGFNARFNVEWNGWGIEDTFFAGNGLMPLWDLYGTKVYWGDTFYNASVYNRTDIYWSKTLGKRFDIRVAMVLHQTAQSIDFCQQATIRVHLWK